MHHAAHNGLVVALGHQPVDPHIVFHIVDQNRIKYFVGRERVGILLVGAQLGRWRSFDDAGRNDRRFFLGVSPAAKLEYQRFRDILDHREAAGHVSVERTVAHGHFAFVPGGQHQPAIFV